MRRRALCALCAAVAAAGCIVEDTVPGTSHVGVGDEAPDFRAELLDGGHVRLSELRGRVVWLAFFASWCPSCREEMQVLQHEVAERFAGEEDFRLVALSRSEEREAVDAFRREYGLTFSIGLDPDRSIYGRYATETVPRDYLIGRDGRVVALTADWDAAEFAALVERAARLVAE